MNGLLSLNNFLDRLENYISLRNSGFIVNEKGETVKPLHKGVADVLKKIAIAGEITRGEVFQIIKMSERTGRGILKGLLDEGLLVSKSEKGAVKLGFPAQVANYWFPNLYPSDISR